MWKVPDSEEWKGIIANVVKLGFGGFDSGEYWSSGEKKVATISEKFESKEVNSREFLGEAVHLGKGQFFYTPKGASFKVRAVASVVSEEDKKVGVDALDDGIIFSKTKNTEGKGFIYGICKFRDEPGFYDWFMAQALFKSRKYCSKCKWKPASVESGGRACFHPREIKRTHNFWGESVFSDTMMEKKNSDNNCLDFESNI